MFSFRKLNTALRLKSLDRCTIERTVRSQQATRCLCTCNSHNNCFHSSKEVKPNVFNPAFHVKNYCTARLPKNADVFGDIGFNNHERCEMDEMEKEEEEFTNNEAMVPKWQKLSPGQYAALVKSHISKGDLASAVGVLNTIRENRDKPSAYIYSLLIRSFAVQGNLYECFRLYNQMKKRNLVPNHAVYNSLLNACAVSKHTQKALERLHELRQLFHQKSYPLNETHYNTMIKAYSWHNKIYEAFELVDEMRDKRIPIGSITYCVLLHAAIGNKEAGLRYALIIWHMMERRKVKRNIFHYNLLLKAMRDTKLGVLSVNDILIPGNENTQVCINENERPDLLASPPILSTVPIPLIQSGLQEFSENTTSSITESVTLSSHWNKILVNNRLLLFGGYEKILKRMENDNVKPDAKTMTLLMEMLPNSVALEDNFVKYLNGKKIEVDIQFYNMLIRKRAMRQEYDAAKDVLKLIQRSNLTPDIVTFGVLSMGCKRRRDGLELIEGMELIGYAPNTVILNTLLKGACYEINFRYVLDLFNYMDDRKMKLSDQMLEILESFDKTVLQLLQSKNKHDRARIRRIRREYKDFTEKCQKFIDKAKNEHIIKNK